MDSLPLVAMVLVDIKDTKRGEDTKALVGSTVLFNGQYCGATQNSSAEQPLSHVQGAVTITRLTLMYFIAETVSTEETATESLVCAQNNRETMRHLMEGYRERKAKCIEENAYIREQQKKEAEKVVKKKGVTVKDLCQMLNNKDKGKTTIKTGLLGKTTARKSTAQPPEAHLVLKPGEPVHVAAVTIKKPKFGKRRTPLPKGMEVDPIIINSLPLEGLSASKNLDQHV
ncbi:hypothetical protein AX15_005801 [Amanita polypyramis BW_CC]|nr:hypothetical protein AX15_005801 [Amanita polypyramis BW_CC]